jgi:hypothetical protein
MPRGQPVSLRLDPMRAIDFESAPYGGAWRLLLTPRSPFDAPVAPRILALDKLPRQ